MLKNLINIYNIYIWILEYSVNNFKNNTNFLNIFNKNYYLKYLYTYEELIIKKNKIFV